MANEYLTRTPTSTGNRKVWTWSGWVKLSNFGVENILFGAYFGGSSRYTILNNTAGDIFQFFGGDYNIVDSSTTYNIWNLSTNLFRDCGSWMHVMAVYNTTESSAEERFKMYVNGKRLSLAEFNSGNATPAINSSTYINAPNAHFIGAWGPQANTANQSYEGEMFDVLLVDGQALTPDVFGFYKDGDGYMSSGTTKATDFRPGQWMPHAPRVIKKSIERRGGFGVNGYYLPMNDSSNPGADFHCASNSIITLKGEDLPQPQNGAPTTTDAYVSQLREEVGTLGFDGVVKFDGTGDCLSLADSSDFSFDGDFTVEAFVYQTKVLSTHMNIFSTEDVDLKIRTDGKIRIYTASSGTDTTQTVRLNKWTHLALVRQGSTIKVYFDGIGETVSQTIASDGSSAAEVGRRVRNSTEPFSGFISNLRVIKGTALYTANFTAPTEPLTDVTNTKLLCCNSSTSATAATVTPGTITANGNVFATRNELTGSIVAAIPGISGGLSSGYGDYSADIRGSGSNKSVVISGNVAIATFPGHYGSGMRFSGSGNSNSTGGIVYINSVSDFNVGLDDFTLEGWIFAHSFTQDSGVFGLGNSGTEPTVSWTNGVLRFRTDAGTLITAPNSIAADMWHHVVLESHNQLLKLIINGVVVGTHNNTHTFSQGILLIGSWTTGKVYGFDGDIQDVRLYNGIAKYKGGFDVSKPYTPVGIEAFRTTADTCKNNFATLNPLVGAGIAANDNAAVLRDGNLYYDNSNQSWTISTIGVSSGKYYAEFMVTGGTLGTNIGVCGDNRHGRNNQQYHGAKGISYIRLNSTSVTKDYNATSVTETPGDAPLSYESGAIVGVTIDFDNKEIKYYKNGTLIRTDSTPASYTPVDFAFYFLAFRTNDGASPVGSAWSDVIANFGQNSSFSGQTTAGTNADGNGKGLFKYAPPTGFLALCEDNLPTPAIADPGKHFKSVLYTGSGGSKAITGVGFKPDLVWAKSRTNTEGHIVIDSVRGVNKRLLTMTTSAEATATGAVNSFDDDGYSTGVYTGTNQSGQDYVAWCWKAGGAAVSNTDGSITSQVSVNQDAGFSIVKFTAQTSGSATVGHGLGKKPDFWIYKPINNTTNWYMYHQHLGASAWLNFTTTAATTSDPAAWGGVEPTSTVLTHGSGLVNQGSCILYAWAEIEGYSKFGSYVGNGVVDGPFVYCGFKPAFVLTKLSSDTNGHWILWDSSRTPTNLATTALSPNNSWADITGFDIDLLSNGFKQRDTETSLNASGKTYIFAAFAESPFQTANAK